MPLVSKAKKKFNFGFEYIKNKTFPSKKRQNGADLDKKLVYSLSKSKIPTLKQLKHSKKILSPKEAWIIKLLMVFIIINLAVLGGRFYKNNLKKVPIVGGEYIEGVVGSPRYINPLYSQINDVDSDIGKLVFSSLYEYNEQGELVKDLVEEAVVNEDSTGFVFTIKDGVRWHSGEKLTAGDIVFTFNAIKNANYNSPLRSRFSGVEIKQVSEDKVEFTLSESYAPFKQLLTFGILPQNVWAQIPVRSASLAELNLKPIGSGPYQFQSLIKDKMGNIKAYNLVRNKDYYREKPFVETIRFDFFVNYTEAISELNRNKIDGIAHLPYYQKNDLIAQDSLNFYKLDIPRINSIFFNQDKNSILEDKNIRQALAYAIDRQKIANGLSSTIAEPAKSPFPSAGFAYNDNLEGYGPDKQAALELLEEAGWERLEITEEEVQELKEKQESAGRKEEIQDNEEGSEQDEAEEELSEQEKMKLALGAGKWFKEEDSDTDRFLSLELTTVDSEEHKEVVNKIKEHWEDVGVKVKINIVPVAEVKSKIVDTRDFEALYYTQVADEESDYYAFWHSSQAGTGGLNIADYSNEEVDELLEETRVLSDKQERIQRYEQIQKLIIQDLPVIPILSPKYFYVQGKKVKGFETSSIYSPKDRFSNISNWYIKTGEKLVW